jgi:K+-sensing histidine kinase KdpD
VTYDGYLLRVHPDDRERTRAVIERALEERHPFEVTHRIVLDEGTERTVSGSGRVVLDGSGAVERMVGTAQDVTERHRLEEVRENILLTVSHELRTPLTSILGFSLTLRERGDQLPEGTRREMMRHLVEQSQKLERLLADLLDLDRLRHGRIRTKLEPTDVGELVERIAASHSPDSHTLEVDAERVLAEVDPGKVERIVENLIANAIKHASPGTVSVSVSARHDGVLIAVDDTGPGIPEAHRAEIFELFTRGGSDDVPGAGIGLALVGQFAALQGGKAWVEDNSAGGASFRVLLPQRAPSA